MSEKASQYALNDEFQQMLDFILDKTPYNKMIIPQEIDLRFDYDTENVGVDYVEEIARYENIQSLIIDEENVKLKFQLGTNPIEINVQRLNQKKLLQVLTENSQTNFQITFAIVFIDIFKSGDTTEELNIDLENIQSFNAYLDSSKFMMDYISSTLPVNFPFIKNMNKTFSIVKINEFDSFDDFINVYSVKNPQTNDISTETTPVFKKLIYGLYKLPNSQ